MGRSKKVGIVHYRVGRTDGVSLEIEKRRQILQDLGCEVRLISGPVQNGADFVIPDLEFDSPEATQIKEASFGYFGQPRLSATALMNAVAEVSSRIEASFDAYCSREKFDAILLHNVFSHGRHIAAASAFAKAAARLKIPFIATNHDYYFERPEYQDPNCMEVRRYLDQFVPPRLDNVTHVSINSLARRQLLQEKGIDSIVLPDVFDFRQKQWATDSYNSDFLQRIGVGENDLVVLQATRIVGRKGIEIAIDFVDALTRSRHLLEGRQLYNGKVLTEDSSIVLVLAGYAEESAQGYFHDLRKKIQASGIQARFVHELIGAERSQDSSKAYSLWDAYVFADLVTYPSLFEGWGNQFIEAVFARKPIVLFEYPVFVADIKSEGYDYITLGAQIDGSDGTDLVSIPGQALRTAVSTAIEWLVNQNLSATLEKNASIGEEYHGYHVLDGILRKNIC